MKSGERGGAISFLPPQCRAGKEGRKEGPPWGEGRKTQEEEEEEKGQWTVGTPRKGGGEGKSLFHPPFFPSPLTRPTTRHTPDARFPGICVSSSFDIYISINSSGFITLPPFFFFAPEIFWQIVNRRKSWSFHPRR